MEPDKFGHCVQCHKNMIIEQVIDGKPQKRFTPDYDEVEMLLSDKSKMRVVVCKQCKAILTQDSHKDIMASVVAGWQEQVNALPWSEEKKQTHMDRYSKLEIVTNADNIPDDVLDKKFKEHTKKQEVLN